MKFARLHVAQQYRELEPLEPEALEVACQACGSDLDWIVLREVSVWEPDPMDWMGAAAVQLLSWVGWPCCRAGYTLDGLDVPGWMALLLVQGWIRR